jgi:apolipoprotein N-acyltransferase
MSRKLAAIICAAILLAAPFLSADFFPLAWIAFVPLFYAVGQAENLRRAALYGWLMGFVAHIIGFHWLVYTISVFGGFHYVLSTIIFVLYAALQGLQMALFALAVRGIGFGPLRIFPAIFWVTLEFSFPLLFPWYLANSQSSFSWFIQTADLVGPYGASWVLLWFNAALTALIFTKRSASRLPLAYALLFAALSVAYGYQRLAAVGEEMAGARKLRVAAVQGNIDVDLKWNPILAKQNLDTYLVLTQQLDAVPLVVWPETAVEVWLPEAIQVLPMELAPALKAERAHFIFGARSFRGKSGARDFKAFNTAFLTDAKGRVLARYHKQVLLAFGEYLPFAKILSLLPALPFADGFSAGDGPRAFHLPRGIRIAPLICYEDLMPDLARKFVSEARANVLVNLTNDAWYGRSVAPWQHNRLAQWRAIETRRSLLRVTNTGVTSVINAKGEVVRSLPTFQPQVLETQLEVMNEQTYYVRFGDWFAWGITLCSLVIVFIHTRKIFKTKR